MIYIFKVISRINNTIFKIMLKIKYGRKIKIGKKVIFRKGTNITIEKNGILEIGNNTFFNKGCSINCMNRIVIGNNNLFGENVKFYDHDHKINSKYRSHKFNYGNISIGDNNWIGSNSIILRKTNIGNGNVFSCNSIINDTVTNNKLIKIKSEIVVEDIKYKED